MKSKLFPVFMLLCFLLFGSTLASAGVSLWGTIWAGQTIHAADFNVYTSGDNLYVRIIPLYDWELAEVHVHANADLPPMNKKGGARVGHFMWKDSFDPPRTGDYTFVIPFSTTGAMAGQNINIAIHVVVVKTDEMGYIIDEETGWGGPCHTVWDPAQQPLPSYMIPFGNSWGYYFMYML